MTTEQVTDDRLSAEDSTEDAITVSKLKNSSTISTGSFFGLIVKENRLYSQVVPRDFKLTMACFGADVVAAATGKNGGVTKTSVVCVLNKSEEFTICTLYPGTQFSQQLDLVFEHGQDIAFKVIGDRPGEVHLTGYFLDSHTHSEDEECTSDEDLLEDEEVSDSEMDSLIDDEAEEHDSLSDEEDGDEDDDVDYDYDSGEDEDMSIDSETGQPRICEIATDEEESEADDDYDSEDDVEDTDEDEMILSSKSKKRHSPEVTVISKKNQKALEEPIKKAKIEAATMPTPANSKQPSPPKANPSSQKENRQNGDNAKTQACKPDLKKPDTKESQIKKPESVKKPVAKVAVPDKNDKKEAEAPVANPERKLVDKSLPSGLRIQDIKAGDGTKAKTGRRVGVSYTCALAADGTVVSKHPGTNLLFFTVGEHDKKLPPCMELGVRDMSLGGVRRLIVPPHMAYGDKGQSDMKVPPNAALTIEVKLEKVDNGPASNNSNNSNCKMKG